MRQLLVVFGLVAFSIGLFGCGSETPRTDSEGKTAKAPEAPPTGP